MTNPGYFFLRNKMNVKNYCSQTKEHAKYNVRSLKLLEVMVNLDMKTIFF